MRIVSQKIEDIKKRDINYFFKRPKRNSRVEKSNICNEKFTRKDQQKIWAGRKKKSVYLKIAQLRLSIRRNGKKILRNP